LLLEGELTAGLYRLAFDTATYFGTLKVEGLYPIVEVTFQAREGDTQFHIPLLLSANGYTTCRGSGSMTSAIREWLYLSVCWIHALLGNHVGGADVLFHLVDGFAEN
jgi:hypothetical protein